MLTAFKPQPIIELKKQDKSRIESLLAYGDRLLVGLNTGVLRIYRLNETDVSEIDASSETATAKTKAAELLREEEKFSKKPIQQLAVIKEAGILVVLSDGYVCFYDLQSFTLSDRLEKTKGATCFSVISTIEIDESTGIPSIHSKLAVAVKRKVLVWSWQQMEMSESVIDLSLVATVKSITWMTGSKIVAGMDPGYVLVDIETEQLTDIHRPVSTGEPIGLDAAKFGAVNSSGMGYMGMGSWVPKPLATKLSEEQMLLSKDVNTLFIDQDGNAIQRRQVPWLAAPEAIGYSYPYLLSLQPSSKGVLEIRNPDTTSLLQSINLPSASIMHVPQPNISLAHAGKGFLVSNDRCIWRMSAFGYSTQIDDLVDKRRFDEALSFVSLLEDSLLLDRDDRLREIKILKAEALFASRKYRDALDLFSEASAPPSRVITLYPKAIAGDLAKPVAEDDDGNGPELQDPGSPRKKAQTGKESLPSTPRKKAIQRDADATSIRSHKRVDSEGSEAALHAPDKPLEGRDLQFAANELFAYLAQTRVQLQKHINYDGSLKDPAQASIKRDELPPFHLFIDHKAISEDIDWQKELLKVAILVDTTLFRAFMLARPGLAGSLFRLENFCSPDVVEEKLYETGRYNDLIDFLYGKKLHKEALELLQKFGKTSEDEDMEEALRGPRRTVAYLQQLPFELVDLVLKYAQWPIKTAPDMGMEVFLADTDNAENLPRERVFGFLMDINPRLAAQYLEHIIEEWGDTTSDFHQRLVGLYLTRLNESHLSSSSKEELQQKLETFLTSSNEYNKQKTLSLLPSNDPTFHVSRAIILSKLHRHLEALSIYVFDLQDHEQAESYCNRVYLSSSPSSQPTPATSTAKSSPDNIYTSLLSLYLTPPPSHSANLDAALSLLSRHGSRLPALSTLNLLPHSLPIRDLEAYFRGRMRTANSLAREEAITAALAAVQTNDAEARLLDGRRARAVVAENRLCGVCGKRFGRQAIRVWPDGRVVHYACGEPGALRVKSPGTTSLPRRGVVR